MPRKYKERVDKFQGPGPNCNNGFCECGCGKPAPIATCGKKKYGWVKGKPVRFIRGHHGRKPNPVKIEDRGYVTACWVWHGANNGLGYGVKTIGGKSVYVHRPYYECKYGIIPEGLEIDHLCRVPACVNPDHLEAVTRRENVRRGLAGENVRRQARLLRKLTDDQVREVRASTESGPTLAKKYNVHNSVIYNIWHRKRYKEVA